MTMVIEKGNMARLKLTGEKVFVLHIYEPLKTNFFGPPRYTEAQAKIRRVDKRGKLYETIIYLMELEEFNGKNSDRRTASRRKSNRSKKSA